jgi:hypothetical protein
MTRRGPTIVAVERCGYSYIGGNDEDIGMWRKPHSLPDQASRIRLEETWPIHTKNRNDGFARFRICSKSTHS